MIKHLLTIGIISVTLSGTAQTQIYMEDFESGIPVTYTLIDNDGNTPHISTAQFSDAWISLPDPLDSTDTIVGSTSYFDPTGTADRWLITPQITLGAFGNFLYWEGRSHDASYPDGYYVLASKTDTQISSFTDTVFFAGAELFSWNLNAVNLSDFGLDGEQVHFAFVNRTYDGFKLYLDSISVTIEDPVGISEISASNVQMYPNPANDVVYFNAEIDEIRVYSTTGQLVKRIDNATRISIEDLPVGVYHIEIVDAGLLSRKKLIKN